MPSLLTKFPTLVEGLFTICVGVGLFFLLPGTPDQPRPLGSPGLVKFSDSEHSILTDRVNADNSEREKGAMGAHLPWSVVVSTVCHYRRWLHFVSSFCLLSTWSPLTTYTPSIIMYVPSYAQRPKLTITTHTDSRTISPGLLVLLASKPTRSPLLAPLLLS